MKKAHRGWRRFTDYQALGTDAAKLGRSVWLAGLGAAATAGDEAKGLFASMVEEGERLDERRREAFDQAKDKLNERLDRLREKVTDGVQGVSAAALHRVGIPTHADIQGLLERVEQLSKRVHAMGAAH